MLKNYVAFHCNKYPHIVETNGYVEQEDLLGQYIEDEIEKRGVAVSLESFTDWGFVFLCKINGFEFDVILRVIDKAEKMYGIVTISKLNRIEKTIGKNDEFAHKGLNKVIDDILRLDSAMDQIEWYDKSSLTKRLAEGFKNIVN